jgi:hypothetical protein
VRRSSRARRIRLTVTREGRVVVVMPRRALLREADALVRSHADWIDRHVGRARAEEMRLASRPALGDGRTLVVDGRPLRVELADRPRARVRGSVRLEGDRLVVRVGDDGRPIRELLEAWLRDRAREAIAVAVARRAGEMGVHPGRVSLRDPRTRWGSASVGGSLSFSWRLVLAPPAVLDAVVVHELAHLRVRDHSRAFWDLVHRHAPGATTARRWLRDHGRELHAALD